MRHYTENNRLWESYSQTVQIAEARELYAGQIRQLIEQYIADPSRIDEAWWDKLKGAVSGLGSAAGSAVGSAAKAVGRGAAQVGANISNIAKTGAAAAEAKAQARQLTKLLTQADQIIQKLVSLDSNWEGLLNTSLSLDDLNDAASSIVGSTAASAGAAQADGFTKGAMNAMRTP